MRCLKGSTSGLHRRVHRSYSARRDAGSASFMMNRTSPLRIKPSSRRAIASIARGSFSSRLVCSWSLAFSCRISRIVASRSAWRCPARFLSNKPRSPITASASDIQVTNISRKRIVRRLRRGRDLRLAFWRGVRGNPIFDIVCAGCVST